MEERNLIMTKKIECFKVVAHNKSIILNHINKDIYSLVLTYKLNTRIAPVCGKIFTFSTLEAAKDFVEEQYRKGVNNITIFKGVGENPHKLYFCCFSYGDNLQFWINYKNKKRLNNKSIYTRQCPEGTIVVDAFTPTEIII